MRLKSIEVIYELCYVCNSSLYIQKRPKKDKLIHPINANTKSNFNLHNSKAFII